MVKCLQTCWATALSKDQGKTLEPDQGEVHSLKVNQNRSQKNGRKFPSFKEDKDRVPTADSMPDANHQKKSNSKEFVTSNAIIVETNTKNATTNVEHLEKNV